jgi:hypothetical protein
MSPVSQTEFRSVLVRQERPVGSNVEISARPECAALTRYYFDIRDNTGLYPDEEGLEFGTQQEAEVEAAQALADLARDLAPLDERQDVAVEVRTDIERVFKAALIFNSNKTTQ